MSKLPLFGILNHKISILENSNFNEISDDDWQEKYTTFAQIKPLYDKKVGSIENFSFGHLITEEYFLFKTRGSLEINNKMRIKFKNRLFDIKRVIDIDQNERFLQIIALEINN